MNVYTHTIANQIKQVVQRIDPTAVTILYGSRATGKAKKDSDWDVLVLVDKPTVTLKDELLFRDDLYEVELEIGQHISPLFFGVNDWNTKLSITPLYQSVQREGIVL